MLKPLNERVIVKPIEAESETAGGIIIPDNARDKPSEGEIIAVTDESKLKTGARVLFGKYSGVAIKHEGEDLLIMREDELICEIV